jgi:ribonuclease P protein component
VIGRIVRPADFQRVLAAPQRSRSAHFAIHYLAESPSSPQAAMLARERKAVLPLLSPELSTGLSSVGEAPVEDSQAGPPGGVWLGLVVPKRHAKRAVTRNLIKRQVRSAMAERQAVLPGGLWVVRLRAGFDRTQFLSPASDLLRAAARDEVAGLFDRALRAPARPASHG